VATTALPIEPLLVPLDAARSAVLRLLGRYGRRFLVDRSARVALYGAVGILSAAALTLLAPLWSLAFGPLLLGVPHLLVDARYLVARPRLHERRGFWLLVAAPLALTLVWPQATTGLLAVIGAALLARGSAARRVAVLVAAVSLTALTATFARLGGVAMAHVHNVVALVLWVAWAPREVRVGWRLLPLALFGVACALLFSGSFDAALHAPLAAKGLTVRETIRALSPVRDATWGGRLVLFFAFSQSVHYAIWLRLVPEEDRPRAGIRSFAASVRALVDDMGWLLPLAACAAAVGLVAWGLFDPRAARLAYLRVALFHGPLEIAVAALLFIERRPLRAS
jgi:hypothetical protein